MQGTLQRSRYRVLTAIFQQLVFSNFRDRITFTLLLLITLTLLFLILYLLLHYFRLFFYYSICYYYPYNAGSLKYSSIPIYNLPIYPSLTELENYLLSG